MGISYPQFKASSITPRMIYWFEVIQSAELRVHDYPLFVIREEKSSSPYGAAKD
jgi:hypothetical protein